MCRAAVVDFTWVGLEDRGGLEKEETVQLLVAEAAGLRGAAVRAAAAATA
jgi:hypothetical protein